MVGTFECGNELSSSITCRELRDWLITGLLLKKGSAPSSKSVSK
jgi:hypothetical protein